MRSFFIFIFLLWWVRSSLAKRFRFEKTNIFFLVCIFRVCCVRCVCRDRYEDAPTKSESEDPPVNIREVGEGEEKLDDLATRFAALRNGL